MLGIAALEYSYHSLFYKSLLITFHVGRSILITFSENLFLTFFLAVSSSMIQMKHALATKKAGIKKLLDKKTVRKEIKLSCLVKNL